MAAHKTRTDIRLRSIRLRKILTILFIALCLFIVPERFGAVGIKLYMEGGSDEIFRKLGLKAISIFPEMFYLAALWFIRQAMADFAAGKLFTPTIARTLHRVGLMLAIGAFISVFLTPSLQSLIGADPGYWMTDDVSSIVLGAVGLSLSVLANVLQHASSLQAELDEIF
jgi:Protein of unknown function (DUF2975)